jgi:hypothetical protein
MVTQAAIEVLTGMNIAVGILLIISTEDSGTA